MDLISIRPYREGTAVIIGFLLGLFFGLLFHNMAFSLALCVGVGAVIDGILRIRAAQRALH